MKKRQFWIDFAKGLSIIFVVAGHSGDGIIDHYLGWLRMPLFFFVSGYLFKGIRDSTFSKWSLYRSKQLLTPYFSYGIATSILLVFVSGLDPIALILNLIYGGDHLTGIFGAYWFITCLLITQIAFAFILRFTKKTQIIIIVFSYILAHTINWANYAVPWSADSALITICYFALGFYLKDIVAKLVQNVVVPIITSSLVLLFIILDFNNILTIELKVKSNIYPPIALDILVPLLFVFSILAFSYFITKVIPLKYNFVIKLGTMTTAILYLHMLSNKIVKTAFSVDYGFITYTLVGIVIPVIVHLLIKEIPIISNLFIGNSTRKQAKHANAS